MLSTAFLASAPAPVPSGRAVPSQVLSAEAGAAPAASAAPAPASGVANRAAEVCALACGAVAVRAAGRRLRAARRSGGAALAAGEAPPPPPAFEPSKQIGAMAPLGFFDPLGFTKVGDEAGFRKLRAAELKHGRVAMMASVGLLGQHFVKLPGFEKAPAGLAVLGTAEGVVGIWALLLPIAFLELAWREEESREPGNFGDPFGVKMYNEDMRTKEISNGRFAMICVAGILAAELATGKDAIQQLGF